MEKKQFTQEEKNNFNNSFLEAYFLGKGDHGTAYIYPSDNKKVVLITNEYDTEELNKLIPITAKLKQQGINVPEIYDFYCPNKKQIAILEDRIVGITVCNKGSHGENKNKWLRLLSLSDKAVAKLFEDINTILKNGILLDVFKADNLIWTPQGYAFIDLHSPSEKLMYLTKDLSFAAFAICDNLLHENIVRKEGRSKREFRESLILKSACFFKLTKGLCLANMDENEKDKALLLLTDKWQKDVDVSRKVYPHISEGEQLDDAINSLNKKILENKIVDNATSEDNMLFSFIP